MLPTLSEQAFAKITINKEFVRLFKVTCMVDLEYDSMDFNPIKNL